jgi:hypothetical protein
LNNDFANLATVFENDVNAFRLLKSLQQIEIEKALNKLQSKAIVWYQCVERRRGVAPRRIWRASGTRV